MSKEVRTFIVAALLGAVSGSAACAGVAHFAFPSYIALAAIVGAVVGTVAGSSGESAFEAAVACIINGVLVWILLAGFLRRKAPSSTHELVVMLLSSVLLGMAVGMLAGSFARKP